MEREARQQATTTSSSTSQSKDKENYVIETPGSTHPSQELEALQRGEEFKQGLAKLSAQLWTHVQEDEPQLKKKKTQLVSHQPQVAEALMPQTEKIRQQVLNDKKLLQIGALSL